MLNCLKSVQIVMCVPNLWQDTNSSRRAIIQEFNWSDNVK